MATLTTSWRSYASASFSTGPATIAFYLEARYTSQSTANNTTNVQTRLRSAYTKGSSTAGTGYKFTCTYASTVSGSGTWTFENEVITSGSKTVTHKTDGTQTISLNATAYNKYWGFNKSMSATVSLPTIERLATITSGTDFTDEGNPTIKFTNPAGFNIQPYINFYDQNDVRVLQFLGTVGRYTSPYTWSFTEEQRQQMRSSMTSQMQYRAQEGVQTYNGSTLISGSASSLARTITFVNASPDCEASYQDTNPATIAITGDNQKIIRNQSTLQIDITNAEAKKEATLSSLTADINGNVYTGTISGTTGTINVGTLDLSENEQVPVRLTDSRGFTVTAPLIVQILDWQLPTANITLERQNNFYSATDITVDANYSSLDGNNTIDIKVRTKKTSESTYGSYTNLTDNVTTTLTLDNLYEWDVQVLVADRLGSTTYNLQIGKGMPIIYFDRLNRSVGVDCFPVNQETLEIKNQDVYKLFPVVLYDNQSGSRTAITVSDDTSNYSYLEIFYGWEGGGFGILSTRIDLSKNKDANLSTIVYNNGYIYFGTSKWAISGTTLTPSGEYWRMGTNPQITRNQTQEIAIFRVLGYK